MPEGSEVRCIANCMRNEIINRQLIDIKFLQNSKIYLEKKLYSSDYEITHDDMTKTFNIILNQICIEVTSYGKKICILFNDFVIVSSLNMEGRWSLKNHDNTCLIMSFDNCIKLYFRDIECRANFGIVKYDSIAFNHTFSDVGYDMQKEEVKYEHFIEMIGKKKYRNKKLYDVLLDQSFVSGIGNYLRSEIIYHAKIRHDIIISELTENECSRLFNSIKHVMEESYNKGGLTLSTYTNLYDECGSYIPCVYMKHISPDNLQVHVCLCSKKRKLYYCIF